MTDRVPAEQVMREMIGATFPDAAPDTIRELAQKVADTGLGRVLGSEDLRRVAARFVEALDSDPRAVRPLDFTVLADTVQVRLAGQDVTPSPRKERAVLLGLLLRGGQASREQLIDDIWGDQPPRPAVTILQTYVTRIRRLFRAHEPAYLAAGRGLLTTIHDGYGLNMKLVSSDLQRALALERLAQHAQDAGDFAGAYHALDSALGQFQGSPLAEETGALAKTQGTLLAEWRLVLAERRLELAQMQLREVGVEPSPELQRLNEWALRDGQGPIQPSATPAWPWRHSAPHEATDPSPIGRPAIDREPPETS